MSFLKKVDSLHGNYRNEYPSEEVDEYFNSFIKVEPVDVNLTKEFIIRKQEKSKLLIVSGKQRVHLSDYQILSTILQLDKSLIDWFIQAFIDLYNNKSKTFKFKVEGEEFKGVGIDYYSVPKEILLFSDTKIDINDFIFVLNFIFSKDYQWEQDKPQKDYSKRTIIKYITLLDYYSNMSERSKDFLEKIGYPLENTEFIDVPNTKSMFSQIKLFDISKFL